MKKDEAETAWNDMLMSLAAAKDPRGKRSGAGDLVNALVFASRVTAHKHPKWIDAQTAVSELVEKIADLTSLPRKATARDVSEVVDYIVMIAELHELPALPERSAA
jgi:hypothetical protein